MRIDDPHKLSSFSKRSCCSHYWWPCPLEQLAHSKPRHYRYYRVCLVAQSLCCFLCCFIERTPSVLAKLGDPGSPTHQPMLLFFCLASSAPLHFLSTCMVAPASLPYLLFYRYMFSECQLLWIIIDSIAFTFFTCFTKAKGRWISSNHAKIFMLSYLPSFRLCHSVRMLILLPSHDKSHQIAISPFELAGALCLLNSSTWTWRYNNNNNIITIIIWLIYIAPQRLTRWHWSALHIIAKVKSLNFTKFMSAVDNMDEERFKGWHWRTELVCTVSH